MQLPPERVTCFIRAHHAYTIALNAACADAGISLHQYLLLTHLARVDASEDADPTMTQLAAHMQHTTAAATGLVDRIENNGYIRRDSSSGDRRVTQVLITARGLDLIQKINLGLVGRVEEALATLEPSLHSPRSSITANGIKAYVEQHRQPARTEPPES